MAASLHISALLVTNFNSAARIIYCFLRHLLAKIIILELFPFTIGTITIDQQELLTRFQRVKNCQMPVGLKEWLSD
jgi:hypothetical protein